MGKNTGIVKAKISNNDYSQNIFYMNLIFNFYISIVQEQQIWVLVLPLYQWLFRFSKINYVVQCVNVVQFQKYFKEKLIFSNCDYSQNKTDINSWFAALERREQNPSK